MIDLGDNCFMVEHTHELPQIVSPTKLYMDFETRSGDRKRPGDNPWAGDRICGAAVTWDRNPKKYYVPVRHNSLGSPNIPVDAFQRWLREPIETCAVWENHNVKFDAHFAAADGAVFRGKLSDTLTKAKLIDSDRGFGRGGYGLDALSADWLENDIDPHDQAVQGYLASLRPKSKDYADCPPDIMGRYACQDVETARDLGDYCETQRAAWAAKVPRFDLIWGIEERLTPVLWDMEQDGLRVDPQELMIKQFQILTELHAIQQELHEITGYPVEPSNAADCYELICNRFGLPVLAWADDRRSDAKHNPSFDKYALRSYLNHPDVAGNERLTHVFSRMLHYRKRHTMLTFFVEPYLKRQVSGVLHPQYNQLVRTGRMSSKQPNAQQLTKEAKSLVHPDTAEDAFLSCDGSQIEFRLIEHYARDSEVLEAYARDPDTDFHQWVADAAGMDRDPAKTMNFCVGYGGGKAKVLQLLASNMQIMRQIAPVVDQLIADDKIRPDQRRQAFEALCTQRANDLYNMYHRKLPGIKAITKTAALIMKSTGYAFNEYGRIRRLPERASWRTLNSLTQGLASDIIKYGMVQLAPRYNERTRAMGMKMKANVHDEVLSQFPREALADPATAAYVVSTLETLAVPLRVPIRFGAGAAHTNWMEAGGKAAKLTVDRELARVA